MRTRKILALIILVTFLVACVALNIQTTPTPEVLGPPSSTNVKVVLQRLQVDYMGQDGHRVIGSGCPGNDGKGSIENYHFVVKGVNSDRKVQRVLVAGDNSTLTWEWPCSDAWGLLAQEIEGEIWDVYIAPSSPTGIYTIIFFYDDNTMAMGMVKIP